VILACACLTRLYRAGHDWAVEDDQSTNTSRERERQNA
jgi:hypothetical protein